MNLNLLLSTVLAFLRVSRAVIDYDSNGIRPYCLCNDLINLDDFPRIDSFDVINMRKTRAISCQSHKKCIIFDYKEFCKEVVISNVRLEMSLLHIQLIQVTAKHPKNANGVMVMLCLAIIIFSARMKHS